MVQSSFGVFVSHVTFITCLKLCCVPVFPPKPPDHEWVYWVLGKNQRRVASVTGRQSHHAETIKSPIQEALVVLQDL